jgi:hypothetical protein
MSLLSTLALLMLPAAIKPKADRTAELEAEIVGLKVDLADARRDRDDWRSRADAWRARAIERIEAAPQRHPLDGAQIGRTTALQAQQLQGLAQYAQHALAQQVSQQQDNAMQQNLQNAAIYGQGLLQHQGLFDNEMWCNCVPSRAQAWTAGGDAA